MNRARSGLLASVLSGSLTNLLITINVIAFFLFFIVISVFDSPYSYVVLTPSLLFSGYAWTLLTSMFLHAGFFHLFVNMISFFFLGNFVEKLIGKKRMFWLYFASGIVGGLFFAGFAYLGTLIYRGDFLFGGINESAVGASGALFGLVGVLAMLIPNKKVYLIAGPLILIILQFAFISYVPDSLQTIVSLAITVVLFLMIFSFFYPSRNLQRLAIPIKLSFWAVPIVTIVPLFAIGFFVKLPIGNTAHLGVLIAGLVYGYYLRLKYSRKIKLLNRALGG